MRFQLLNIVFKANILIISFVLILSGIAAGDSSGFAGYDRVAIDTIKLGNYRAVLFDHYDQGHKSYLNNEIGIFKGNKEIITIYEGWATLGSLCVFDSSQCENCDFCDFHPNVKIAISAISTAMASANFSSAILPEAPIAASGHIFTQSATAWN